MEGNRNHLHVWDSQTMVVMHLVLNINFAPSASQPSSECSSNTNPMILHYLDDTTTKSVTIHSCGLQRLTDLNLKLYTAARWLYNYDFHHSPPPIPAHKENSKKNSDNLNKFEKVSLINSLYRKRRETNNKSVAKNRARKKEEKKAKEVRSK